MLNPRCCCRCCWRRPRRRRCLLRSAAAAALVAGAAVAAAPSAARAAYSFTPVADTSGPYAGFNDFNLAGGLFGSAQINNSSNVAFFATLDAGGEGIFRWNPGIGSPNPTTTTIATTGSTYSNLGENPSINSSGSGVVAFQGTTGAGHGVFSGTGGAVSTLADVSGPLSNIPNNPSINLGGAVAFRAGFDAGGEGIVRSTGGTLTTIADTSGILQTTTPRPRINGSGVVAFTAQQDGGGVSGIYTGSGGVLTTVADSTGAFANGFAGNFDINDAGEVAFRASLDAGGSGIYTAGPTHGPVAFVTTSGPYASFGDVDINAANGIVFEATLDTGPSGIFTGPDGLANKVVVVGDPLLGSTLTNFDFLAGGANDAGSVAFVYRLQNGTSGVALAVVPEPATAAGTLLTLTAGATLRRRRRTL